MDWTDLVQAAAEAAKHAYVPYSHYPVGAAALVDDGRMVTGCNVENASIGLTLCAECGLVSTLMATGGGKLTHFTCVNGKGEIITACGRCRQLLMEHGGPTLAIWSPEGECILEDLLPQYFGPNDLDEYTSQGG
ncbi:MAG: cytidine deaminase [Propionibacteriaceae bacterium]|jgi:cytidine deaminase|nr:cytidine deaminase [Propionibacteriaceae bacterium]